MVIHVRIVLKHQHSVWAFDDKLNKEAVFIVHNGSNYNSHLIMSYLFENT